MSDRLDVKLIEDTDDIRVWTLLGKSERLVVSFSGIGRDDGPIDYGFANSASENGQHNVLFIADPKRSWLNANGLIEAITKRVLQFAADCKSTDLVSLGHSMGGFMALALPAFVPTRVAIGLSPQYSVHPDLVPTDNRWMNYRSKISNFVLRDLGETLNDVTRYYVFHGKHGREAPQRDLFPFASNIHQYVFPNTVHNVSQKLKNADLLKPVLKHAMNDRPRMVRQLLRGMAFARTAPNEQHLSEARNED